MNGIRAIGFHSGGGVRERSRGSRGAREGKGSVTEIRAKVNDHTRVPTLEILKACCPSSSLCPKVPLSRETPKRAPKHTALGLPLPTRPDLLLSSPNPPLNPSPTPFHLQESQSSVAELPRLSLRESSALSALFSFHCSLGGADYSIPPRRRDFDPKFEAHPDFIFSVSSSLATVESSPSRYPAHHSHRGNLPLVPGPGLNF
jgi:hypothetical protein